MKFIPYGHQKITQADRIAVDTALLSDWLTQGPRVKEFEDALSVYCNVKYAVAVANGTAALHLACLALDIKPGDYLWTSPNTFVASANCGRFCGANIDFVDIDPVTYNLSVTKLEEKLVWAKKNNCLPKVVIPVHFAGLSCDMKKIKKLAEQYNFYIIEDACHAIGGKYGNSKIGSCQFSDMAVFSFHPVKVMTTGEGGAITTNNPTLAKRLRLFASHAITRDQDDMSKTSDGPWYYEQIGLGFNFRITDMQCALGLSQLQRLDQFVERRRELVNNYHNLLKGFPVILPIEPENYYSAYHLYVIQLRLEALITNRRKVFDGLREANIGVNVHYIPVHTQPYYQSLGFKCGDFPNAENYYSRAITLPLYVDLTFEEQKYIAESLHSLLVKAEDKINA